jgi:amidase
MDPFPEYESFDAVGLAELVADGDIHPRELVAAVADRIERRDGEINAVISTRIEAALAEAAGDVGSGPFAGVPILIKDLVFEEGVNVTFGSAFFRDHVAQHTSEFRTRLSRAGFIDIGRTNTPEFGLLPTTEPVLHGPTRNPWNVAYSAGGSSGGAAAAVAAGIVPLAQGSDGGGSIRIPASACGLFGLKPSRGRNPRRPAATSDYLSVELGLTRTVRDTAALLDAVWGPVPGDRYWAPLPETSFREASLTDPGVLRIAYTIRDFRGDRVHPDAEAAVLETVALLDSLGHQVVEARPGLDGSAMAQAFLEVWASLAAGIFRLILEAGSERPQVRRLRSVVGDRRTMRIIARLHQRSTGSPAFEPFTRRLAERSMQRSQADLIAAETLLEGIAHTTGTFLEEHDMMLSPVLGAPPVRLDTFDQTAPWEELTDRLFRYVAFTPLANFGGFPAMSVPLHWTSNGLPVGAQFTARFGDEVNLLRLAGQLERAQPWRDRVAPLFNS